jgi:8-amino-7-oxononanoate synthase
MVDPYQWLDKALTTIHQAHWYRQVTTIESPPGPVVHIAGQSLINFASNDYLGLANDPRLKQAAIQALETWGTGSTGSRLLSGHRPLHQQLEQALATWKRTEAALVFSSGYLANLGTILALVGPRDLILEDEYNHSSLKRGGQLSGATVMTYQHGDVEELQQKLAENRQAYRRCLMVSDGVFSMDGDVCPLPALLDLAKTHGCMVLIDDAHGTGTLGQTGAGCREYFGWPAGELIQIGTLSKALGSLGGYVAGSARLIDYLRNRAATWIYSTGLSPADTAAALAAVHIIQQDCQCLEQLKSNVTYLKKRLDSLSLSLLPSDSPIICIKIPYAQEALQLAQTLKTQGIFAPAIRPPTVPTSRLRLSVMATHSPAHLDQLIEALAQSTAVIG